MKNINNKYFLKLALKLFLWIFIPAILGGILGKYLDNRLSGHSNIFLLIMIFSFLITVLGIWRIKLKSKNFTK